MALVVPADQPDRGPAAQGTRAQAARPPAGFVGTGTSRASRGSRSRTACSRAASASGRPAAASRRPTARTTSGTTAAGRPRSRGDPVAVEAAELVDRQTLVLGLHGEVRDRLTGVVDGPGPRGAVRAGGLGGDDDERGRRGGPGLVARRQGLVDGGELGRAAAGHREAPGLAVVGTRRPPGGLEQPGQLGVGQLVRGVQGARAPASGEQGMQGHGGDGGLADAHAGRNAG